MAHARSGVLGVLVFVRASLAFAQAPAALDVLALEGRAGTEVSVGGRFTTGTLRREVAGFVALTLPFDAYAAPRRVAQAAAGEAPAADAPEPQPEARPEAARRASKTEPEPEPKASRVVTPRVFLSLARGSVQQAELTAGIVRRESELESLASRARTSAALPVLRLRVARTDDEALRLAPTTEDPYRYTLAGGSDLTLEASATFRLDRLLFAGEEVAITRLRLEREKGRAALVARTLERLFAWRRALETSLDPALDEEARLAAELERWEAQAELDVLTAGWFSERLSSLGLSDSDGARAGDGQERENLLHARADAVRNQEQSPGPPKAR